MFNINWNILFTLSFISIFRFSEWHFFLGFHCSIHTQGHILAFATSVLVNILICNEVTCIELEYVFLNYTIYMRVLIGHFSWLGQTSFELSEEVCNGIPRSIYCGINASSENTFCYCCWFISCNGAYQSLGGRCKVIFE